MREVLKACSCKLILSTISFASFQQTIALDLTGHLFLDGPMHIPVINNPLFLNALTPFEFSYVLDYYNVMWLIILLCEKDTFLWFKILIYKLYFCSSGELCCISPLEMRDMEVVPYGWYLELTIFYHHQNHYLMTCALLLVVTEPKKICWFSDFGMSF